jgi:hypothetical protein
MTVQPLAIDGADAIEYKVVLDDTPEGVHFERTYSVAGWQMEHEDIWIIAKTFLEAANLIGVRVPVPIYGEQGERASVNQHAEWLEVVISGGLNKRVKALIVEAFLEVDGETCLRYCLRSSPEAVTQFGRDLEKEIALAAPRYWSERFSGKERRGPDYRLAYVPKIGRPGSLLLGQIQTVKRRDPVAPAYHHSRARGVPHVGSVSCTVSAHGFNPHCLNLLVLKVFARIFGGRVVDYEQLPRILSFADEKFLGPQAGQMTDLSSVFPARTQDSVKIQEGRSTELWLEARRARYNKGRAVLRFYPCKDGRLIGFMQFVVFGLDDPDRVRDAASWAALKVWPDLL